VLSSQGDAPPRPGRGHRNGPTSTLSSLNYAKADGVPEKLGPRERQPNEREAPCDLSFCGLEKTGKKTKEREETKVSREKVGKGRTDSPEPAPPLVGKENVAGGRRSRNRPFK